MLYSKERYCNKLLSAGLLSFFLMVQVGHTQSELPVLVKPPSAAKVMMIVDDSGSMNAVIEHPDFNPSDACVIDAAHTLPSVIFRLQSAGAAPALTQQLSPVLIELNTNFYDGSASGALYSSQAFSTPTNFDLVEHMSCNNSAGSNVCCPGTSGSGCPKIGINAGELYGNGAVIGSSVFQVANLASSAGSYLTDSTGNEYLYLKYRRNDYENGTEEWNDVWAKFDASGNLLSNRTTPYVTTGGTVVFNGVEAFLSNGWYRKEYLKWIFYCASAEQISELPGVTRLQAVQNVMTDIISGNPTVSFGIATLNGSTYSAGVHSGNLGTQWYTPSGNATTCGNPQIRNTIGTSTATLISSLATLTPRGGTPLTATFVETLRYFGGAKDSDSCTGSSPNYTSPITNQCDAHSIILLTDGLPTSESARKLPNGSFVTNLDGVANSASNNGSCSTSDCIATFLPDASWWGYHSDLRSPVAGIQNVVSYAIAFGVSGYPLLNRFAQTGGSGSAYTATTSNELTTALSEIVGVIFNTPTSGAGVATLEKLFGETKVYQPIFYADSWVGKIQVFDYDEETQDLDYEFDMSDVLESRNLVSDARNIIAGYDADFDGRTSQTLSFNDANAASLRPSLFKFYIDGTLNSSLLASPLTGYTTTAAAQNLISYIHGNDASNMRTRDRDADGLVDRLGDIVYSKPVEVGAKNGILESLSGYSDFIASRQSQPRILLVGSNDGMLHAFNSATGRELWAYIPSSQLPHLERLARLNYNSQYRRSFVDGQIAVEDAYLNGAWRTIAMFGLRTGGSTYTVLDITDRSNPSLIWEVSDSASYGQSWSKPTLVVAGGSAGDTAPGDFDWYMVVGTGEGKTTSGSNIVAYDLNSATPPTASVKSISSTDPAGARTSSITAAQTDQDRNVDRLYLGTEEGDLFRVHVIGAPSSWVVQKIYDGTNAQPIVASPLTVLAENPQYASGGSGVASLPFAVGVYFGTGRHDKTSDITSVGSTTQSIFGLFDPVNVAGDLYASVLTNQTKTHLQNQSVTTYSVRRDSLTGKYYVPSGKSGFYIDLATSITVTSSNFINPVGEVVNPAINVRGIVLFTTFLPDTAVCDIGGFGFLQGAHFQTGGGVIIDNFQDSERSFYNGGIPDINGDGQYTSSDLSAGLSLNQLQIVLDEVVTSIDLSDDVTPYEHDGILQQNDVRLHSSNGGIIPAVSSIGHTGVPSSPAVLLGKQVLLVQDAYPSDPGNSQGGGSGGDSENGEVGGTDQMPPPKLLPINIYNLLMRILSFHEVTGN